MTARELIRLQNSGRKNLDIEKLKIRIKWCENLRKKAITTFTKQLWFDFEEWFERYEIEDWNKQKKAIYKIACTLPYGLKDTKKNKDVFKKMMKDFQKWADLKKATWPRQKAWLTLAFERALYDFQFK